MTLNNAIDRLHEVRKHANDILDAIKRSPQEGGSPMPDCVNPPMPSLEELLNTGPQRIDQVSEDVHRLLDEIKNALF